MLGSVPALSSSCCSNFLTCSLSLAKIGLGQEIMAKSILKARRTTACQIAVLQRPREWTSENRQTHGSRCRNMSGSETVSQLSIRPPTPTCFLLGTHRQTGVVGVETSEPTAVQVPLDVIASTSCVVPTNLQELALKKTHRPCTQTQAVCVEHTWPQPITGYTPDKASKA